VFFDLERHPNGGLGSTLPEAGWIALGEHIYWNNGWSLGGHDTWPMAVYYKDISEDKVTLQVITDDDNGSSDGICSELSLEVSPKAFPEVRGSPGHGFPI
jgi:hypothetical protein